MTTELPSRALIVDDDPVVARAVARSLQAAGYMVTVTSSCKQARSAGRGFWVAVFDLDLPDGGGAELAEALLDLGAVESALFYSGTADREHAEYASTLGPVIEKTRSVNDLLAALPKHVSQVPASHIGATSHASSSRLSRVLESDVEEPASAARHRASSSRR